MQQIISPRAIAIRKELCLPADKKALLMWDVFKGQCTSKVEKPNIKVVYVWQT